MRLSTSSTFGVNVIGHVSGNLGLGVLARHVVSVLASRGCPVRILDIDPQMGRGGHDRRFAEHSVASVDELTYPLTFLLFPPTSILSFMRNPRHRGLLSRRGGLNAALVNWEHMVVPAAWVRGLSGLDVIVAPSAFTREAFERALPNVPVIPMKVPLGLPAGVQGNRARFGLQSRAVWFGSGFEPQSDPVRKNPFAVLDAFERAVPGRRDVGLVIKLNNATVAGQAHPIVAELRSRARRDGRIILLEETLDYRDVLSLYASLDVFVSLHRSEGIGLSLIEAMSLGKPVIATGWSGNMSFMDRSNSCVVGYRLIPARGSTYVYTKKVLGPRAVWAEPDVTNAAEWMRALVEQPDVREGIGRRASEAMRRYQEEAQRGLFLDELRMILESEVAWGIDLKRRSVRRDCLERWMGEGESQRSRSTAMWIGRLKSLAKKAGFRKGRFPYWTPPRRSKT